MNTHLQRPKIVCLCGSTRFMEAFQEANLRETVEGHIVLSVGCNTKADAELFLEKHGGQTGALKQRLDELHKRKIDLADDVLVLNIGGYVGESTRSEIEYAKSKGKPIRYLEPGSLDTTELPATPRGMPSDHSIPNDLDSLIVLAYIGGDHNCITVTEILRKLSPENRRCLRRAMERIDSALDEVILNERLEKIRRDLRNGKGVK
jgi:hypothetical protein